MITIMAYLSVNSVATGVVGLGLAAVLPSAAQYIDAAVLPGQITRKQVVRGLLIVGAILAILSVLLIITLRMQSSGWLPLILLLLIVGVAALPILVFWVTR